VATLRSIRPDRRRGKPGPTYYGCGWQVRSVAERQGRYTKWHFGMLRRTSTLIVARHDGINWAAQETASNVSSDSFVFNVTDAAGNTTVNDTLQIQISPPPPPPPMPPVLSGGGNSVNYTPQGAAVAVDAGLVVSDASSATLAGATVAIGAGFFVGDMLNFANQNGITGSYVSATGVLTLSLR